ncbi:MAG: hypothetical protein QG638_452 [Pseudomonadota bacterium]|nr:hypothetical protein [Pseudomonadota bacterium]
MKLSLARICAVIALVTIPLTAQAREAVPIVDYPDNTIFTSSGQALTTDQVKNAIVTAATGRSWQVAKGAKGEELQAMLQVRGKHTVVVTITYSAQAYSILYQNSTNMKYSYVPDTNTRVIHPYNNRWVSELREGIRMELNKL